MDQYLSEFKPGVWVRIFPEPGLPGLDEAYKTWISLRGQKAVVQQPPVQNVIDGFSVVIKLKEPLPVPHYVGSVQSISLPTEFLSIIYVTICSECGDAQALDEDYLCQGCREGLEGP